MILRHSCRLFNIGKLLGNLEDDKIFQRTSLVIETSLVGTQADQDNSDNDLEGTVSKQSTHTDQAIMTLREQSPNKEYTLIRIMAIMT